MATFRLTVDIDADVKKESHTIAIAQGKQLREVVEQALREYNAEYRMPIKRFTPESSKR